MRRLLARLILVAAIVACLVAPLDGWATLRRTPGSWLFGPSPVWTDGTTGPTWHALSAPMSSAGMINVRVSTELDETSGNCKIRPALRWSNDAVAWDADVAIVTTYRSTVGVDYGSSYIDITALGTPKPWVQFGVEVANTSGTRVELCAATVLVDPKER